ncbi:hypothetical protein MLD38_036992 [Melastoma candidum]|uniref:Uncharacterized protein n=1 Tax=Melastoma candidum TaxID=119954 RepID=A0ACB9LLX7_9MYRT|nr:hypothetical protein MLD38_036992 [Melastoma candidum]
MVTTLFMDVSVAVDMTFCHNGCEKLCEDMEQRPICTGHCRLTFCQENSQECRDVCCRRCRNAGPYRKKCLEKCVKQLCPGIPGSDEGSLESRLSVLVCLMQMQRSQ